MKRPKIKTALTAVFLAIVVMSAATGYVSLSGLDRTNNATEEIATNWLPSVKVINAINTATSDYRIGEGAHIMSNEDSEMARAEKDIKDTDELISTLRSQYEKLISSDHERQVYSTFSDEWKKYLTLHETMLTLSRANKNVEAATLFKGDMRVV